MLQDEDEEVQVLGGGGAAAVVAKPTRTKLSPDVLLALLTHLSQKKAEELPSGAGHGQKEKVKNALHTSLIGEPVLTIIA